MRSPFRRRFRHQLIYLQESEDGSWEPGFMLKAQNYEGEWEMWAIDTLLSQEMAICIPFELLNEQEAMEDYDTWVGVLPPEPACEIPL